MTKVESFSEVFPLTLHRPHRIGPDKEGTRELRREKFVYHSHKFL